MNRRSTPLLMAALLAGLPLGGAHADPRADSLAIYKRAYAQFQRGDVRAARVELLNAIKTDPQNGLARLLQARVYLWLENGLAAQSEIDNARRVGVPVDKTHHLMAHALLLQDEADRALAEADRNRVPIQFASYAARIRGRAQALLGKIDLAAAEFALAVRLAPDNAENRADLARFKNATGDAAGAMAEVDRALRLAPRDVTILSLKGALVRAASGPAAALPWFDKALAIDGNDINTLLERGATLSAVGRNKDMLVDTRRVLSMAKDHPLALYLHAVLAARAGNYPLAAQIMERTRGALDQGPHALLLQGVIAFQTGNYEQAQSYLQKLTQMQPDNLWARRLYGAAQFRGGDLAGTVRTLRPLADRPDADALTLGIVGSAFQRGGQPGVAATYLQRAQQAAPESADVLAQLALSRSSIGDIAGAQRDAQRLLASDPGATRNQLLAGIVALRASRPSEALAAADKVLEASPGNIEAFKLKGGAQMARGDLEGAEATLRAAVDKAPRSADLRRNLAEILVARRDFAGARAEIKTLFDVNANDVQAMLVAARLATAEGKTDQALDWLKRATLAAPQNARARIAEIGGLIAAGRKDQALVAAAAAEQALPRDPAVLRASGGARIMAGRPAEAVATFTRLAQLQPDVADPLRLLAAAQGAAGQRAEARRTLDKAAALPGGALAYGDIARMEQRQGNIDAALAAAEKLVAAQPQSAPGRVLLGDLQGAKGRTADALRTYEAARQADFTDDVLLRLVGAYRRAGRDADAMAALNAFAKAKPDSPTPLLIMGDIQLEAGRWQQAVGHYERLRKERGDRDPAMLNNLAWAQLQLGRNAEALEAAEKAWKLAPDTPPILDTYGWVLASTGTDRARGIALLRKAAEAAPGDPGIRWHLAQALAANGDRAGAISEARAALALPGFAEADKARAMVGAGG